MNRYETEARQLSRAEARMVILRLISELAKEVLTDLADIAFKLFQEGALSRLEFSDLKYIVEFVTDSDRSAFSPYSTDPLVDGRLSPEALKALDGSSSSELQFLRVFREGLADWARKYSGGAKWQDRDAFFNWLLDCGLHALFDWAESPTSIGKNWGVSCNVSDQLVIKEHFMFRYRPWNIWQDGDNYGTDARREFEKALADYMSKIKERASAERRHKIADREDIGLFSFFVRRVIKGEQNTEIGRGLPYSQPEKTVSKMIHQAAMLAGFPISSEPGRPGENRKS